MGLSIMLPFLINQARIHNTSGEFIFERARECGIEPYLMQAIADGRITAQDLGLDDLDTRLKAFKATQTARLMLWNKSLKDALKVLDMPAILLKGAPLSERLTGSALWRESTDIDLWVAPDKWESAVQKLKEIGYWVSDTPHLWATNQILLSHTSRTSVEIHWELAPPPWKMPTFERARKDAQTYDFQGIPLLLLSDGMQYLHLLVHAHQHYFALKSVIDFELAQNRIVPDANLITEYGLNRLESTLKLICNALSTNITSHDIMQTCMHLWYDNLLSSAQRGTLVFGRDSKRDAALGVLLRAMSMALLNGYSYPIKASLNVIFAGPHCIGRFNVKHLSKRLKKFKI